MFCIKKYMQNISFTGKADIIFSKKIFENAIKNTDIKEVCPFPRYLFSDGDMCKQGYSQFANTCTTGFIHNGDEGFMFHIAPEIKEDTTPKFLRMVEHLKENAKENLTAFLTGGWDQFRGESGKESFKTFDKIANALDNDSTDLSIIWGKKYPRIVDNLMAFVDGSKFIMKPSLQNNIDNAKIFIPKGLNIKPTLSNEIANLEDTYSIVEINPKHKLIFDV